MTKLVAAIRLLRPLNCFIGSLSVFVSAAITRSMDRQSALVIAMLVVFFYNGGANAINDYFDYEIDKINRPDRPLSSGLLSRSTAVWISFLTFGCGTLLVIQLNQIAALIAVCIAMPILLGYTRYLKTKPLIGNFAVAFILGLVFVFGGAVFGAIDQMLVPAILAFLLTFPRELIKDVEDIDGDKKLGLKTYPISAGISSTKIVVKTWSIITGIAMLIPSLLGYYNNWYFWFVLIGIEIPLVYILTTFSGNIDRAGRFSKLLKMSTIAGVCAVYFGTI